MDNRVVPLSVRYLFGFSRKEIVTAVTDYLTWKGYVINEGEKVKSYVFGLEREQASEDEIVLTLIVDEMPNIMRPCEVRRSASTVKYTKDSVKLPGQQKFELTHRGVKEALSASCVTYEGGRPLPSGPISWDGLEEPNGGLTLFVDPL